MSSETATTNSDALLSEAALAKVLGASRERIKKMREGGIIRPIPDPSATYPKYHLPSVRRQIEEAIASEK